MDLKEIGDVEDIYPNRRVHHHQQQLWPLNEIDPYKASFPCCIVWTPLPVVSWLAPFIGHVGICREDGVILDFSGSNFVNTNDFAYGAVARYLQLDREKSQGVEAKPLVKHWMILGKIRLIALISLENNNCGHALIFALIWNDFDSVAFLQTCPGTHANMDTDIQNMGQHCHGTMR
ncbi:hypothetical protein GIB67_004217 [Kingdonia uniflora]|uniref:Uncharacterized protein n=1 Tax=Kingdonia uniflora TaxID=39325 RepID=A0A7J7N7H6_9MAGN|nr:hypothetical protein GIB67_004217 [Kingdonia uniflora]